MIRLGAEPKILLWSAPIDFRKGMNGLVALVADALTADPYCGDVFVFRSKRNDRLKLLVWDGTGLVLATKWLEAGRIIWPPVRQGVVRLSAGQYALLADGLDWTRVVPPVVKKPVWLG